MIIINFQVVTKGAGRIAEVSARFTLDAMPGKQMSIDADLNAGIIDQDTARQRRIDVTREADFYGSMDGASKFVKGDAVAGLLIMLINLVGGIIIGTFNHGLSVGEAASIFAILTIGDGLVAHIPSLLLSVASAIIVTRQSSSKQEMGQQVVTDLFSKPKTMYIVASVLAVMGVVPGMPHVAFLMLASICAIIGVIIKKHKEALELKAKTEVQKGGAKAGAPNAEQKELSWDDVSEVDVIGLEVGYRLYSYGG